MPTKDGTGPQGLGSRTGRGLGNCSPSASSTSSKSLPSITSSLGWGGRMWNATFGRFFGRKRGQRINRN